MATRDAKTGCDTVDSSTSYIKFMGPTHFWRQPLVATQGIARFFCSWHRCSGAQAATYSTYVCVPMVKEDLFWNKEQVLFNLMNEGWSRWLPLT